MMTNNKTLPSGQLLDKSTAFNHQGKEGYELAEILNALGLSPSMRSFDVVARDLSRLAHHAPPWTKKYVHSVYKGHIVASPEFSAAVEKLAQIADGTPVGVAGSVFVKVLADPRKVAEGILIPANAQVVKCSRPGCPVWYLKVHPRQIYHDPECRRWKLA